MTIGRNDDIAYSILLITPILLLTSMGANPLYIGAWYYLGVPAVMLLPGLIVQPPPLFFTGTTAAVILSFLAYVLIQFNTPGPDGLLGLGHVFSLPGILVGTSLAACLLKYRVKATLPWLVASISFIGATTGFMVAQMIVCNTVLYCGWLTFVI